MKNGLSDYLLDAIEEKETIPDIPFTGKMEGNNEQAEWALLWLAEDGTPITESYANLIPTPQGGTHVNGLRTGLTEAIREFCEFRNLLPRGVKITPDDVWDSCCYILSVKLQDPFIFRSDQGASVIQGVCCLCYVGG